MHAPLAPSQHHNTNPNLAIVNALDRSPQFIDKSIHRASNLTFALRTLGTSLAGLLLIGRERQAHTVDAMPLIRGCVEAFALEHMPQVAAAIGANNLRSQHAEGTVLMALNGAGQRVEVSWPAAARFELVRSLVQRRGAPGAGVDTLLGVVLIELSGARGLGSLLAEDAELFLV